MHKKFILEDVLAVPLTQFSENGIKAGTRTFCGGFVGSFGKTYSPGDYSTYYFCSINVSATFFSY